MCRPIIDLVKRNDIVVVFDVDGVLAPYEWGSEQHAMPDAEWDKCLENNEDIYARITPVKEFVNFIRNKQHGTCYVCSRSADAEAASKRKFCVENYNIPDENIVFVKEKSDKLIFLEQLRDKLQIPENKIAIVEDTVKTLDKIAKKHWDVEKREASAEMAGNVMEAVYQQNGPIIDALSSTKYDNQRIARDLPVKVAHKIGDAYDFRHDVAIVYTNSPYVIAIFTDHSNYDTISNISKDIYEVLK